MSIVTKTGDLGTTGLMYNRRVPKDHPRVEAYGAVDELNAALGLARATAEAAPTGEPLAAIQKDLIVVMGELATASEDRERYFKDGFLQTTPALTSKLELLIQDLEAGKATRKGWATPGSNLHSAALDMARTICRRAERRVCSLQNAGELHNPELIIYLNRLSDLLWLLARAVELPK
jgi:cob(I)alamin adenosyltransferase